MQPSDSLPPVGRGSGRLWPVADPVPRATRRTKGLPGAWAVLFQRAVGSDPAGCASRLAHRVETAIAFRLHNALGTQNARSFVAVNPTAHSLACLRIGVFVTADAARLATGVGGSPFTGRVSHPLDGEQSFMTSPHRHSPLTSLAWSHCATTPHLGGGLLDRGHALAVALLGQRVSARPGSLAVRERHVARLGAWRPARARWRGCRLRAAVRRQSWRKRVGTPAAWQAVRHAVRQRRSDIGQDGERSAIEHAIEPAGDVRVTAIVLVEHHRLVGLRCDGVLEGEVRRAFLVMDAAAGEIVVVKSLAGGVLPHECSIPCDETCSSVD